MTWPSSDIPTGNTDEPGDSPQIARGDILGLMQAFNLLRNHFSTFMRSLAEAADAPAARTALGASTVGSNVFTAADAAAARTAIGAVGTTGAQTVAGLKTFSDGVVSSSASQLLGYTTGAGGAYTQLTSKTTNVTITRPSGQITTAAGSIPAGGSVDFSLLGGVLITSQTIVALSHTAPVSTAYRMECVFVGSGQAVIRMTNTSAGALNEVTTFNYALSRIATS